MISLQSKLLLLSLVWYTGLRALLVPVPRHAPLSHPSIHHNIIKGVTGTERNPRISFLSSFSLNPTLEGNPDEHDDHIKPLGLAIILETPHAVRLLVPVARCRAVHAAAARLSLLAGGGSSLRRGRLALGTGAGRRTCAGGLVELRGGHDVLHDGAVDGELVGRGGGTLGGRFRHYRLEHFLLEIGVSVKVARPSCYIRLNRSRDVLCSSSCGEGRYGMEEQAGTEDL